MKTECDEYIMSAHQMQSHKKKRLTWKVENKRIGKNFRQM